jgi:hypothetical protein
VHEVQVDLIDAEPAQALLGCGHRILSMGIELGRDEYLAPVNPAGI